MRGVPVMAGLLLVIIASLVAVSITLGGTVVGGILLVVLVAASVWPGSFLLWVGWQWIRFARERSRIAIRLEQEIDRSCRAGDRIVLCLLRFPRMRWRDFPFFGAHRASFDALQSCFRSYDQVGRIGFAGFLVVLPGKDSVDVVAIRERLLEAVRREHRWRVRVGMSVHPEDGLTPEILLDHADRHCA